MNETEQARAYAQANGARFVEELKALIRIPSVSTEARRKADVRRAAEFLADHLREIGAEHVELMETGGHPVVYADWLHAGENAPTVFCYGHYDIQPATNDEGAWDKGWISDPFEPVERDGFIYARGASDDKGQMFIHLKVLESYLKSSGRLPVNVKFFIEGEEEIGSPNLNTFVGDHREKFSADVCVISDTGMSEPDSPMVIYGLRGLSYMEIHVTAAEKDLHSGGYGGVVHNPALALAQIIAKLHHADNSVAVTGFYDDVIPLSEQEREALSHVDIPLEMLISETGITQAWGESAFTLRERIGARPTMEINGILSGWTGAGSKTVLPATAMAKVSCRLVPNQSPKRIYELVRDYVASITPPTVTSEVKLLNIGDAVMIDLNEPAMQAAVRAYERGWGKAPQFVREGGSIPIVADFRRELGFPVVLMGYGLNSDGAHGPNERYSIDMFHRGIDTAICFLEEMANLGK
jgi:acetylornithine deacetylase/succinyl-diaminopimelate desuccinylase-like protein